MIKSHKKNRFSREEVGEVIKSHKKQVQPRGGGRGDQESQKNRFSREEVGEVIKSHKKQVQPRGGGRGDQES